MTGRPEDDNLPAVPFGSVGRGVCPTAVFPTEPAGRGFPLFRRRVCSCAALRAQRVWAGGRIHCAGIRAKKWSTASLLLELQEAAGGDCLKFVRCVGLHDYVLRRGIASVLRIYFVVFG